MPEVKIRDTTITRYKAVRKNLRDKLGTSKVTQQLINMSDEDMHAFANDLLELFDIVDPILGR
ncbi:MAG: hypothetical protein P1V97_34810 [Planctomycetota bacterium]|nr:hypothetical protein [Planctomycetota bacterium]